MLRGRYEFPLWRGSRFLLNTRQFRRLGGGAAGTGATAPGRGELRGHRLAGVLVAESLCRAAGVFARPLLLSDGNVFTL
jgi:hypothetical protein